MATEYLRPNAAGDETNIGNRTGDDANWKCVDDPVGNPDNDSTYVNTSGAVDERDLYNLPAPSGSGTINWIKVHFRVKCSDSSDGWSKAAIRSDTTVTEGSQKDCAADDTWEDFTEQWATNPADGEAWEWSDIDALQIGIHLSSEKDDETCCTQVYVEIDYTQFLEKTFTESISSTDSIAKSSYKTVAESIGLADSIIKVAPPLIETHPATDIKKSS